MFQCLEFEAGLANAQTQDSLIQSSQHPIVSQVDWMNKFIFDMWPFLDKVLSTFIWLIQYKFSFFSRVHDFYAVTEA